jgi:hypothetical protein
MRSCRRSRPRLCRRRLRCGSQFVIIKDKNQQCRIIEQNLVSEDQLTMEVGKQGYPTREEANIDVKVLCDKS